MKGFLRAAVGLASAAVLSATVGLAAQATPPASPTSRPAPPPKPPSTYRATAWSDHAHGTVVSVVVRIPVGSADDPAGQEGTAALLGEVLRHQAQDRLSPDLGTVRVAVERTTTTYTLLAMPESWRRAAAVLDSALFVEPVDSKVVEEERGAQRARLNFEIGSPGVEFEAEAAQLLAGAESAWARPIRGTPASLAAPTALEVGFFRLRTYIRDDAVRAVVGPRALLRSAERPPAADSAMVSRAPEGAVPVARPPAPPTSPMVDTAAATPTDTAPRLAWTDGARTVDVQDVTSAWIRVAYPVDPTTSRTTLEMLASLLKEDLDPTPPDPDRYGVRVGLADAPGGPVLVVDATVFPEASGRWERKITAEVARLAAAPMGADFFSWRRRRFRTERLLEEAAPEAEARRLTDDLLRAGHTRDLAVEIWGLDADGVYRAAKSLGAPRILIFGPDLGQSPNSGS